MKPTVEYAPLGQLGKGCCAHLIPLAKVLSRLNDAFEEPLSRVATLPGYADYETTLTDFDGWPSTGEPLVLIKERRGQNEVWSVISGLHVLAAAKSVGKNNIPCFFIAKKQVGTWSRANVEGGLKLPRASAEDEEEAAYRAFWPH